MRRKMLEAITYPRSLVSKDIDPETCPHDGIFAVLSERCQNCDLGKECHWLSCIDKVADIGTQPDYTIHAILVFGLSLIEANIKQLQHDLETCTCGSCTWIRNARQSVREFQTLTLGDRYRSVY